MKPDFSYKFTQKIKEYIIENNLIGHSDSILVGLSGGADSVCLILVLNKLSKLIGFDLHAVHINHGIRGESADRDEAFSRDLCEKLEIPFQSYSIDIPKLAKDLGLTLEEAGRNARYEVFYKYSNEIIARNGLGTSSAEGNVKIAVAHHKNDQAETVIFNMIRGSLLKGISGMSPINDRCVEIINENGKRSFKNLVVIRPLLCVSRAEIEQFLKENNQNYCIDETNSCNDYSRNQIRNEIVPLLEEIQPKTVERIAAMASDVRSANKFIESYVDKLYEEAVTEDEEGELLINIKRAKQESDYIVKELIVKVLKNLIETYKDITGTHISDIYGLLFKGKGKEIMLPYDLRAKREKEFIRINKR